MKKSLVWRNKTVFKDKCILMGWQAFEAGTSDFSFDQFGGKLLIRPIYSKRKNFLKEYPNCTATKVRITIQKI